MGIAGSLKILAHRIAWTLVLMAVVATVVGRRRALRGLSVRTWLFTTVASGLIMVHWGVYIWAANYGRIVDSTLGYSIQSLFVVLLGVLVLSEPLRASQWVAIGIATVTVLVLAVGTGTFPWVGLVLAADIRTLQSDQEDGPLDPIPGLVTEGFALGHVAIVYLVVVHAVGTGTFVGHGSGPVLLLAATGPATVVPLLLVEVGAQHLTLTALGVLPYINPTLEFVLGVVIEGEPMPPTRWAGFALAWTALTVITARPGDGRHRSGSTRRAMPRRRALTDTEIGAEVGAESWC